MAGGTVKAHEIATKLSDNNMSVLSYLFPNGRKEGTEFCVGSLNGESGRSLKVNLNGKGGVWSDFATGETGSDLLDLWAAARNSGNTGEAMREASEWLGLAPANSKRNTEETWSPIIPIPSDAPKAPIHPNLGAPSERWAYRDKDGNIAFLIARFETESGKQILPLSYGRKGNSEPEWQYKAITQDRPLYQLHKIASQPDAPILIVEGEKAANAAINLFPDYIATTSSGGGNAVSKTDWGPLKGRHLVIWPDHDEPGRRYAEAVSRLATDAGALEIQVVQVPKEFPDKWDLADDAPSGWDVERLRGLLNAAEPWQDDRPATEKGNLSVLSVRDWGVLGSLAPLMPTTPTLSREIVPEPLLPWLEDAADRIGIPLEFITAPAIVALSSVIGRTVGIHPKQEDDWLVVPNLWGAVIGRPGQLKSPAVNEALKPVKKLAAEAGEEFKEAKSVAEAATQILQARQAGLKAEAQTAAKKHDEDKLVSIQADLIEVNRTLETSTPIKRRYIINDATVEMVGVLLNENPRGLLLYRDELSGWLRTMDKAGREGDREFYLESWNGTGGHSYDRIGRGSIDVEALTLSVFGTIQPGKLQGYINGALRTGVGDDGLLQRIQMLVWPEVSKTWKNVDRRPNVEARDRAYQVFQDLDNLTPENIGAETGYNDIPGLHFDADAQEIFDEYRIGLETRLRSAEMAETPAFESHLSKYRSLMPSLALIFHLVDLVSTGSTGAVSRNAALKAVAWCDFLEGHARKVYAAELNGDLAAAHVLLDKIKAGAIEDEATIREVCRPQWSGVATADAVWSGLHVLEKANIVRIEERQTGARISEVIRIHPNVRRAA
ncbi:MAG: DUF3987 domain-containing protein [Proteobacteria bacterium]|nr:DUF3987 domain-containing protein [Pseudomonadota bacterium]